MGQPPPNIHPVHLSISGGPPFAKNAERDMSKSPQMLELLHLERRWTRKTTRGSWWGRSGWSIKHPHQQACTEKCISRALHRLCWSLSHTWGKFLNKTAEIKLYRAIWYTGPSSTHSIIHTCPQRQKEVFSASPNRASYLLSWQVPLNEISAHCSFFLEICPPFP